MTPQRRGSESAVPECERHEHGARCGQFTDSVEPEKWCRSCLVAEVERLRPIEHAATKYLLSRKGWERWSDSGRDVLYDRLDGFGNGRVFTIADAFDWLRGQIERRRA